MDSIHSYVFLAMDSIHSYVFLAMDSIHSYVALAWFSNQVLPLNSLHSGKKKSLRHENFKKQEDTVEV